MGDAEIIPIGTRGRPGRGSAAAGAKPSSASRDHAGPAKKAAERPPAKKAVRPFVRLYTDHLLNRQAQINLYLAHLLHDNIRETARLQLELQALKARLETLERGGPARD